MERRLVAAKAGRAESAALRERLRAQKCTGPRYPGRPEDYAYRISESCTPKGPDGKPRRAARKAATRAFTRAQTRKELDRLLQLLGTLLRQPLNLERVHGNDIYNAIRVGEYMSQPELRRAHPADFVQRFAAAADALQRDAPKAVRDTGAIPMVVALVTLKAVLTGILDDGEPA